MSASPPLQNASKEVSAAFMHQLSMLRLRIAKIADNLLAIQKECFVAQPSSSVQTTAEAPAAEMAVWWTGVVERLNMLLHHFGTCESVEFAGGSTSFLLHHAFAAFVLEVIEPTPDPTLIPNVLLRKRYVPECDAFVKLYSQCETPDAIATDSKTQFMHAQTEITAADEASNQHLLEWLETRKNAFAVRLKQQKQNMRMPSQPLQTTTSASSDFDGINVNWL